MTGTVEEQQELVQARLEALEAPPSGQPSTRRAVALWEVGSIRLWGLTNSEHHRRQPSEAYTTAVTPEAGKTCTYHKNGGGASNGHY